MLGMETVRAQKRLKAAGDTLKVLRCLPIGKKMESAETSFQSV